MRQLVWTRDATRSRAEIFDHIESDDPEAALALDLRFSECAQLLMEFPEMGRIGRVLGTRELVVHGNYLLIYDLRGDTLRVLRLLHAARQWPPRR